MEGPSYFPFVILKGENSALALGILVAGNVGLTHLRRLWGFAEASLAWYTKYECMICSGQGPLNIAYSHFYLSPRVQSSRVFNCFAFQWGKLNHTCRNSPPGSRAVKFYKWLSPWGDHRGVTPVAKVLTKSKHPSNSPQGETLALTTFNFTVIN